MNPLKKGQPREDDRYMWGRGLKDYQPKQAHKFSLDSRK